MSGSSSDETYLESFIESISTLPHELRRDLELLKDLDCSYVLLLEQLRAAENSYASKVEEKVAGEVLEKLLENGRRGRKRRREEEQQQQQQKDEDGEGKGEKEKDESNQKESKQNEKSSTAPVTLPTTEELQDYIFTSSSNPLQPQPNDDNNEEENNETATTTIEEEYNKMQNLKTKCYKLANEKIEVAEQAFRIVDSVVGRLEGDLKKFETLLKGTGEFEATGGAAKPNDLAAIQVNPNSTDWILAKVISHDPQTAMYKLSDEDVESNKIFNLPESQVVVLGGVDRLSRGDVIYAVYPDTTSFYQATVAQAPRKVSGGGSFVMVNFKDDGDENGVTHDKAVLMKHVMRVPYVLT